MAVDKGEEYASTNGWGRERHYAVPTTDLQCYKVPEILEWLNGALRERIFPALHEVFGGLLKGRRLRVFDAFLVKYDYSEGQRRLPLHNDQSLISLTIAMNEEKDFGGGGTWFYETGEVSLGERGEGWCLEKRKQKQIPPCLVSSAHTHN